MEIQDLPKDPAMLLSYVNTKLRDVYPSLDALCDDMHISREELVKVLGDAGFEYSAQNNKFW